MTSGNRNAPPEQGSWSIPGAAPSQAATSGYPPAGDPGSARGRGRPGVVALVVALVELAVIAAACNQGVYKHALRYFGDHSSSFLGQAVGSSLQFGWRVSPASGDNRNGVHVLWAQLVTIGVLVVVSALLTVLVVRGAVTFWRAFFGIWTAVIAAALLGRVVGALVTKQADPASSRLTSAIFRTPNGSTVFAGAVLGLIAAVVGALFAVATRRRVEAPVYAAPPAEPAYTPEAPPPFYGRPDARRDQDSGRPDPRTEGDTAAFASQPGDGEHGTRRLPDPHGDAQGWSGAPARGDAPGGGERPADRSGADRPVDRPVDRPADEGDNRTTQIPRFDPRGGQHWTPPEDDGQSTQALPNAPDDGRH